jgi:hypothetical protein
MREFEKVPMPEMPEFEKLAVPKIEGLQELLDAIIAERTANPKPDGPFSTDDLKRIRDILSNRHPDES